MSHQRFLYHFLPLLSIHCPCVSAAYAGVAATCSDGTIAAAPKGAAIATAANAAASLVPHPCLNKPFFMEASFCIEHARSLNLH
jgi:hypothetical protein